MTCETLPNELRLVWRAVSIMDHCIYIDAATREQAKQVMRQIITAMYHLADDDYPDGCFYNLDSAADLLDEGISQNPVWRLFETGCFNHKPIYDQAPVFAAKNPMLLMQHWRECSRDLTGRIAAGLHDGQ